MPDTNDRNLDADFGIGRAPAAGADHSLDADFGVQPPAQPGGAPVASTTQTAKPVGAFNLDALGAKAYQAATFGFGADIDRMLFGKQAEQTTRTLSNQYDHDHPLAAFGVDLAMAAAESAAAPVARGAQAVKSGVTLAAQRAGIGAAAGAAMGAGAGGDMSTRAGHAAEGAVEGGAMAVGANTVGMLLRPLMDRLGSAGFSQVKAAADSVYRALAQDGKSPQQLAAFLRQNPNARLADFSPKVADLVVKASDVSNATARQLGTALREDAERQTGRLYNPSQPLMHVKQQMLDNVQQLQKQMAKDYKSAYSEVTPLTPELAKALDHPDVKPLVSDVLDDYRKLRMNPASNVAQAPKYKVGEEIPTAVVDDLQKRIGAAARDPANIGTMHAGALQAAHGMLKDAQPASLDAAQRLAAKIGGEESETGVLGAQQWGSQFAFGLKAADMSKWDQMNPLQREYARLGMADGMERYLREHTRMTEGALNKIADKMNDPQIRNVLGPRTANQIKKSFVDEAARARNSDTMARGGSRRAAFEEENTERIVGHGLNVIGGGAIGSWLRLAKAKGISEAQGRQIIDIATKPGGMQRLQKAGIDRNLLDHLTGAMRAPGLVAGATTQAGRTQQTEN